MPFSSEVTGTPVQKRLGLQKADWLTVTSQCTVEEGSSKSLASSAWQQQQQQKRKKGLTLLISFKSSDKESIKCKPAGFLLSARLLPPTQAARQVLLNCVASQTHTRKYDVRGACG